MEWEEEEDKKKKKKNHVDRANMHKQIELIREKNKVYPLL